MSPRPPFNVLAIVQAGRLQYEAVLLAASLRAMDPRFAGRLILAEPQPCGAWASHATRIDSSEVRAALARLDAEILPFEATEFGAAYPQGNKIEALILLPPDEPFLFLDTDTLITGALSDLPVAASPPTASMRRSGTWPVPHLYGPGFTAIWQSLYRRFDLDFESSLDLRFPDEYWQRYLYFNAGWFCGPDPAVFHRTFLEIALTIRDDPPPELAAQSRDPWLDQIALPLAIHALGGSRPSAELEGFDGSVTCHWRTLPLLFAQAPDRTIEILQEVAAPNWIKRALKEYEPFKRNIYHSRGMRARALFDRNALPGSEDAIRKRLKAAGLWMR